MNIYDFFFGPNINEEMKLVKKTENAILLDVRTAGEFHEGKIPGSIHLPFKNINTIATVIKDKNAPIFVYCTTGTNSRKAVKILKKLGYTNARNIGGLQSYIGLLK